MKVTVDGKKVLDHDEARGLRDNDDVVPLDLAAGNHEVVLRLHQRDGAWAFRARFVDETLTPPVGAYLELPGTTADDARTLAQKMSWVSLDRGFDPRANVYRPRVTVRFPEGAPRGIPLPVSAKIPALFENEAGGVPVTSSGAGELVVLLPDTAPLAATSTLETTVAGRVVKNPFPSRPTSEQALVRLAKTKRDGIASRDTVDYLEKRLLGLLAHGDGDTQAQNDDAKEIDRIADSLEKHVDPYDGRTGFMRRAIRSRHDGEPSEFGLYVPPWYKTGSRKFALVVGLHGLNGYALGMMRWLFGNDDPKRDQGWEDRHLGSLPNADAIVVTPLAHGNTLYRDLGEDDVMQIVEWATKTYAVDEARITITGPSMGGIGSGGIPLRHPNVFAGAMPLCGYHSYLIRGDVSGRAIRPWERFLAEERSNVLWADNGERLPLWIVHGTQDKPEENSGVLIERYEKLGFSIKHEHPDSGHNVWQETYEDLKGLRWLMNRKVELSPSHVRFKTTRTRWNKDAWVTIDELAAESGWGDVNASIKKGKGITVTSNGVAQITLAPEPRLASVTIDGQALAFDDAEAVTMHREGTAWKKGAATHAGAFKHGSVTGPIRDVFNELVLFVYADGPETRANEEVAKAFARIRYGVNVSYPMMSDTEFLAKKEPLANDHALFLVGRDNKVLAALSKIAPMPIEVSAGSVRIGTDTITGKELGAVFVRPNPARLDRYVVVVAGADVPGTLRATSLPDLLPDFVVWDEAVAPAHGGTLLGSGALRAGGFFTKEWALPASYADPLAKSR